MQQINHGQIVGLAIRDGEPVLYPRPLIKYEYKFCGDNGSRPERNAKDFLLKQQVVELLAFFDEQQNIVIDVLEVKHGLPFHMTITEVPT